MDWLGVPVLQAQTPLTLRALGRMALVVVARKASYPQALMKPYRKGER